jgi:hypothetical protein
MLFSANCKKSLTAGNGKRPISGMVSGRIRSSFQAERRLECAPEEVSNLKGDIARAEFINRFKEVQHYKTQLNQYTDLKKEDNVKIETLLSED